jgi:CHAD domain-containing protein
MLEKEVKLGAGPAFHLPNLEGVVEGAAVGAPEVLRLETVYYDTPDLRLARWGVSLRHRAGEGWTLKLAPEVSNGAIERNEMTFPGGPKKVPDAALGVVRAYVRTATVVPVARLSTVRRRIRLTDASGARLAEVVDDEVSVRDGRRVAARFREIEVEVPEAPPAVDGRAASGLPVLEPIVTRLRGAGAGAPDPTPKYVRALGPRALEPPEVAPVSVAAQSPARDVIRSVFAEAVASLLRHDPLVRTSGDPEAVHQARVATRKLRSHLRTFGPLLEPDWTEPLRTELGWLALALGAVRDREVLLDRLRERASVLPANDLRAATSLLSILEKEFADLRQKLIADLDSARYVELLERLVDAAANPKTTPDADLPAIGSLPVLATGPWRRLRSAVRQLPEHPTDPELHRIRILAKRARYAAEAVAGVVGSGAASFARAAAKLQTVLGEHQDSVTAQAWLRAANVSGKRAFAAGELIAMEHIAAEKSRSEWPKAWDALDRKRLRDWMP